MPILSEQIDLLSDELAKLIKICKLKGIKQSNLKQLATELNQVELMILDSAFKERDLIRTKDTLLVLDDVYFDMLQNLTACLILQLKKLL